MFLNKEQAGCLCFAATSSFLWKIGVIQDKNRHRKGKTLSIYERITPDCGVLQKEVTFSYVPRNHLHCGEVISNIKKMDLLLGQ
jgi:hypothetical protein